MSSDTDSAPQPCEDCLPPWGIVHVTGMFVYPGRLTTGPVHGSIRVTMPAFAGDDTHHPLPEEVVIVGAGGLHRLFPSTEAQVRAQRAQYRRRKAPSEQNPPEPRPGDDLDRDDDMPF